MVGSDLWALDRELEKLSLYAAGREITESDVTALVPYAPETNIFAAVDAIVDGQGGDALRLLTQLMHEGKEPLYLTAMIERQLRLMSLARDLSTGACRPATWAGGWASTPISWYARTQGQARRRSLSDISRMYQRRAEKRPGHKDRAAGTGHSAGTAGG